MRIGTRSILYGAHCFFIHPFLLAYAWARLYRFPFDPRLWFVFFVHDLGYIGKSNMDGEEGEDHPRFGAKLSSMFDAGTEPAIRYLSHWRYAARVLSFVCDKLWGRGAPGGTSWYCFCFYHSRFLAKRYGVRPSPLCMADKMVIVIEPAWLYLPRVRWSGEIDEYMGHAKSRNDQAPGKYSAMGLRTHSQRIWHRDMQNYVRAWVEEHRDGRDDTWTPKQPDTDSGVRK
jgi:hypothetical protein